MDVDTIPLGVDFVGVIRGWVQKCDVLLALVGAGWSESKDPKTGIRRLDNPEDFVRIEIGEALNRGIPVVPVLLDDAPLPDRDQLPDDLRDLFARNAAYVSFRTFDTDVEVLIKRLKNTSKKGAIADEDPAPKPRVLLRSGNVENASAVSSPAIEKGAKSKRIHTAWTGKKLSIFLVLAVLVATTISIWWASQNGARPQGTKLRMEGAETEVPTSAMESSKAQLPTGAAVPPAEPPSPKVVNGKNCFEIPFIDYSQNPPQASTITRCK
ncbi:TIR domain-containing protein [Rhizobium sp. BK251]|nr:TIR domain-containing protein [Rhizobium sp. BK251]